MTVLDERAYAGYLSLARTGTVGVEWDATRHPRDLNGRFASVPDMVDGKLGSVMSNQVPGLPSNTQDLHTVRDPGTGRWRYTDERQRLHEAIVRSYLAGHEPVPAGQSPRTLFTAGGAGSGKSTAVDALGLAPPDAVLIDPDDVKMLIPERQKLIDEGVPYTTSLIHDESMDIADKLRAAVLAGRYNAVQDGTGASQAFSDRVEQALDAGHDVEVDYFHVPIQTAYKRIEERRQKTGRRVNAWVAWDQHRNASRRFHDVYELGVEVKVYDAEGATPQLIMHAEPGADMEVQDQAAFDAFLAKGDVLPAHEMQRLQRQKARAA